jgi:uncharacterized protein
MLKHLADEVSEIYRQLDAAVTAFAKSAGLSCPQGCGHCCLSESVEATVLECLPLAFYLFASVQADAALQQLDEFGDNLRCILHRPDLARGGLWGCSQYATRVMVCRIFGFAGNRDRDGVPRLAMCRIMKDSVGPENPLRVIDDLHVPMPLFAEAGLRITTLHPGLGTVRLPINTALRQALMKVGMALDLETGN